MIFNIAFKNVRNYWRKSFAAILAVSCGLLAQSLFVGYLDHVENLFININQDKEMFGHILIENRQRFESLGKEQPLKYSLAEKQIIEIQKWIDIHTDEIDSEVKMLLFTGVVTNGQSQALVGGRGHSTSQSQKMRKKFDWNVKYGTPMEDNIKTSGASLGLRMGSSLSCLPEIEMPFLLTLDGYSKLNRPFRCADPQLQITALTESEQVNAISVNVTGLIDGGVRDIDSTLLVTDLESVQKLLNTKKISYWALKLKDEKKIESVLKNLNTELKNISPDLHAVSWKTHFLGELYNQSMSLLNIFRLTIVMIVLIITGTSVFNTSLKSVIERVKEIGTFLSLGFSRQSITKIFMTESILLSLFGNGIGVIATVVIAELINWTQITYKAGIYSEAVVFHINILPGAIIISGMIMVLVCMVTTWFAVRFYVNRKIIENLNG